MKYELLKSDTKVNYQGITLFRIRRLSNKELGGYIEKESNLSQTGNAWVFGNAQVSGDARVFGDAQVSGNAWVSGDAQVSGNALVAKKSECINITNLPFNITITKNHTRIGCEMKLHEDWFNITETEAESMGLESKYFAMFLTILSAIIGYVVED